MNKNIPISSISVFISLIILNIQLRTINESFFKSIYVDILLMLFFIISNKIILKIYSSYEDRIMVYEIFTFILLIVNLTISFLLFLK